MWFLVIALLTGTGDYESIVLEMPSYAECRLQKVGVSSLDPDGTKYETDCIFIR